MSELKLEVGQRVRRKAEEYVVEINEKNGSGEYPFKINGSTYTAEGRFNSEGTPSIYDVVEILPPEPTTPTVELGKWYPCRNPMFEARVLEVGLPGDYAMTGIYRRVGQTDWSSCSWTSLGQLFRTGDAALDLMLTPPEPKRHTITRWVTCYVHQDGEARTGELYSSHEKAMIGKGRDCLAIVPIEIPFTEGEGLEPKQP